MYLYRINLGLIQNVNKKKNSISHFFYLQTLNGPGLLIIKKTSLFKTINKKQRLKENKSNNQKSTKIITIIIIVILNIKFCINNSIQTQDQKSKDRGCNPTDAKTSPFKCKIFAV